VGEALQQTQVGRPDAAAAQALDRDGCLLLRAAIPGDWIEPLRAAFEAGTGHVWPAPQGPAWRHSLLDLDPAVRRVCRLPPLLAAVGRLLGGPFFLAQAEGREPRAGGGHQLLHRDHPATAEVVSALAFLDAFGPGNGGTRIAAGTHRGDGRAAPDRIEHPATFQLQGEAGDVLVFDASVLHGACVNRSGAARRSLLITYCAMPLHAEYEATRALRSVRIPTDEVFAPAG
jgi:hypothetical protein